MGARSYVPQLGRFLQTDPMSGGSANAYAYTYGDPVNKTDLSGAFTEGGSQEDMSQGTISAETQAAQEQAARAEAEGKAAPSCPIASMCTMPEESIENYLLREEHEVEDGLLPSGTDPYLGHGVYVAFILGIGGLDVQFHFNKKDSLYMSDISLGALATWVAATIISLTDEAGWAAAAAGAIIGFGDWSHNHIEANNCIGVDVWSNPFMDKAGYYRSKKECG